MIFHRKNFFLLGFLLPQLLFAGWSLDFNGTSGYAFMSDAPVFNFPGSFTISARFQTDAAHDGCIVAKFHQNSGTPEDDSYYILVKSDGGVQARIQTNLNLATLTANGTVHDGGWHHVALVYDQTNTIAELYLDGQLGASQALQGTVRNNTQAVRIGTLLETYELNSFFNGRIDELRFFDTARRGEQATCLSEVTILYETPGLVCYYRFDEGSGSTAYDIAGDPENATLISGASFSQLEPAYLSRLNGPGACCCGSVSGLFTASDPAVTLVGDTILIATDDTLTLQSHSLTVDSSVSRVLVNGALISEGTLADSSYLLGQGGTASQAVVEITEIGAAAFQYTRLSRFASRLMNLKGPAIFENTVFSDNGGAMLIDTAITMTDCRFENHDSTAVRMNSGSVHIEQSVFTGGAERGIEYQGDSLTIFGCEFTGNGGGLLALSGNLLIDSCRFDGNTTGAENGGAVKLNLNGSDRVDILRCTFENNEATARAGGAVSASGTPGDSLNIMECELLWNVAEDGGGIYCEGMNLDLQNCVFESNTATDRGGAVMVTAPSGGTCTVKADSSEFTANAADSGSAVYLSGNPAADAIEFTLTNSTISENIAGSNGPTLYGRAVRSMDGLPVVSRCTFFDNTSGGSAAGGTILFEEPAQGADEIELRNLTVAGNSGGGSAVYIESNGIIRNTIAIDNNSLLQLSGGDLLVAYCLTSDEQYHGAGGSFYDDPQFEDYAERDFHLTAGSPSINRGDPNSLYNDPDGTRADVGAFIAGDFAPVLESLLDVPHDNGRQLMCQWLPSPGDDSRQGIESYLIYRRVNLAILENFELMAEVPAAQLEGYGQIVPTLADSNAEAIPYYSFFVRAQSVNPLAFWDTPLDSGYSVDNLAPAAPALFAEQTGADIELNWTTATEEDFAYYAVYRYEVPFDPDTVTVIYTTLTDTILIDGDLPEGSYGYVVRSIDINGNQSPSSNPVTVDLALIAPAQNLTITLLAGNAWLRWSPSPEATVYHLYRSVNGDLPGEFFGSTEDTTFLTPLTQERMHYWVIAVAE